MIKEVREEVHKYFGDIKAEKIKEQKMRQIFEKKYLRRTRLVLQSKLNGRYKIKAVNTWAVSLMWYNITAWKKDELKNWIGSHVN